MTSCELGTCGCCARIPEPELTNRAGLDALTWRASTYSTALARMKQRLPETAIADGPNAGTRPLVELTSRSPQDFALALLDACAITSDVLSFYTERIANEGYLRTAKERRSVLEIAHEIGYELAPGVAASAYLALTVETPLQLPGALPQPTTVIVPAGTKVQSIPGTNELPQTFQTSDDITARAEWNALQPRQRIRYELGVSDGVLVWVGVNGALRTVERFWLAGDVSTLKQGDRLLLRVTAANRDPSDPISVGVPLGEAIVKIANVVTERPTDPTAPTYTRVELAAAASTTPGGGHATLPMGQPVVTPVAMTADNVRSWILERTWTEEALRTFLTLQRWDADALLAQIAALVAAAPAPAEVHRFKTRLGAFGHGAPLSRQVIASTPFWNDWDDPEDPVSLWTTSGSVGLTAALMRREFQRPLYSDLYAADFFLDRVVDMGAGGWTLLESPNAGPIALQVKKVVEASLADFSIAGKATGLRCAVDDDYKRGDGAAFTMRTTTIHTASEPLPIASAQIVAPVGHAGAGVTKLVLDRMTLGLRKGQLLAISGETVDEHRRPTGGTKSEIATIERVEHAGGLTTIVLTAPLENGYRRTTMTINANAVLATHGETVANEVLGSGDATRTNQSFTLKRPPVTWISAPTDAGIASTITVAVDGAAWEQRRSLWDAGPSERAFMVETDDSGATSITFGDGERGARLPTGRDNVTATYRTGIGLAGQVAAGKLALMPQKPLALRGVTNPLAGSGAQDRESLDDARRNAPLTVLTLGRIVSRTDYEDFARSFAGIGKAIASELWDGGRQIVHLTIAGADGGQVDSSSELFHNLHDAIVAASEPSQGFAVATYVPQLFDVEATLIVGSPDNDTRTAIAAAVRQVLLDRYTALARAIAEPVTAAELTAVLQRVDGVIAVRLTSLYASHDPPSLRTAIPAPAATWDATTRTITPATLLAIQPLGITIATQVASGGTT